MWNRLRDTVWAPIYGALVGAVGFTTAGRHSIERLGWKDGNRVRIVGAGTGLVVDRNEPAQFRGMFRSITLSKPFGHGPESIGA